jgi:hypothetical protein
MPMNHLHGRYTEWACCKCNKALCTECQVTVLYSNGWVSVMCRTCAVGEMLTGKPVREVIPYHHSTMKEGVSKG